MIEFKIASLVTRRGANKKEVNVLILTISSEDRDVVKLFTHLYNLLFSRNVIFDPLNLFTDDDDRNEDRNDDV